MKLAPLLLAAGLALPAPARAGWSGSLETEPDSGVSVDLAVPYEALPASGFFPLRVTVKNLSGADRSWTLRFSSTSGISGNQTALKSEENVRVAAGQTSVFPLLIPLSAATRDYAFTRTQVHLAGFAARPNPVTFPPANRGSRLSPFVGMSEKIGARSWKPLQTLREKEKKPLHGSIVDVADLGRDWRGYLGMRSLWLTDDEYTSLPPAERSALRDWVLQGGEVVFFSTETSAAPRGDFRADPDDESVFLGVGRVDFQKWDGRELPAADAQNILKALGLLGESPGAGVYGSTWGLAKRVPLIVWNIPLLTAGLVLFAVVVGPVNLFWLARSGRRHRLFWTTPLISVIASVLLGLLILLQEGFGGVGSRALITYLDPTLNRAATFQEQLSKTGVLLQSRFAADGAGYLQPLPVVGEGQQQRNGTYLLAHGQYSGDWFSTRWRQGQFAGAMTASRAEIRVTKPAAASGSGPEILSSLPVTLRDLYLVDAAGRTWAGTNVRPGQRITLRSDDRGALPAALAAFPAGDRLSLILRRVKDRRDFFYAFAAEADFVPTLPAIRWRDDAALYLGPVSAPAPPLP